MTGRRREAPDRRGDGPLNPASEVRSCTSRKAYPTYILDERPRVSVSISFGQKDYCVYHRMTPFEMHQIDPK